MMSTRPPSNEEPKGDTPPSSVEPETEDLHYGTLPPDSFAGYEIVREIHRGGQGVVYQAIQKATKRKVAIKVMKEGPFASKHEKARFEREIDVLAQLNHPSIVGVIDSGVVAGNFYFVMDYISGRPLDAWMADEEHSIDEVLRLFARIGEAVNAAHLRGIIHRDLKPGNIRIGVEGEPHILDFGLAKVARGTEAEVMTMTGDFIGSLPWASPEQAEGVPAKIDTRTDVYSLGVILYQMLTGRFPYDVAGSAHDVLDRILHEKPARPSAIRREINDEVETIVLKCLDKQRVRRYQTAGELARDIGHYLNGEAIEAKRDSTLYILRKHLWQYRLPLVVAAGFVLMTVVGLFVSLALWRQAARERDRAVLAETVATAAKDGERRQREIADEQRSLAQTGERNAQVAYAEGALDQGTALHLAGRGRESRAAFVRARDSMSRLGLSTRAAEVGLYRSFREFEAPVNTLTGHTDGVMAVAFHPDGVHACSASEDGTVRLWDLRTGEVIRTFRGHTGTVTCVAVSPDGRYLLSGGGDQTVRLWDVGTGRELQSFYETTGQVRGVAFSPDGRLGLSATAERGGAVRLWDVHGGKLIPVDRRFETAQEGAYSYYGVAFSPDGRRFLATTYEGSVWIWDARTGQALPELRGHAGYVISAAFSLDGDRVLSASFDGSLRLWNVRTGDLIGRPFKGHTAGVRGVAFVPRRAQDPGQGLGIDRGDSAVSCSMDSSIKLWNIETGEVVRTFAGHTNGVRGIAVSSDGRRAVSAGEDATLRVWDLAQNAEAPAIREAGIVTSLSCSSDGMTFVSGDTTGSVKLRDLATFRVLQTFTGHTEAITCATLLGDSRRLFTADRTGNSRLWNVDSGRELRSYPARGNGDGDRPGSEGPQRNSALSRPRAVRCTSVSADGRLVISSKPDRTMDLWSVESGTVLGTLPACRRGITCIAVSPDSTHALCGDEEGEVYYWDLRSLDRIVLDHPPAKPGPVDCVAFSADGGRALTGGHDCTVRLWDLNSRRVVREFFGHTMIVMGVGFGRGDTAFSAGADQTLKMWDVANGCELKLGAHLPLYSSAIAVVPPGDAVLVGSGPWLSLWDIPRAVRHLESAPRLEAARSALRADPNDGAALATLGEWYAFRGVDDWALELLEKARANGTGVSSLTLARCSWRLDRMADAAREFRNAMARREAPADYLSLCLAAVTTAQATPQPATAPAPQPREGSLSREGRASHAARAR
jgi:WD40 repeat protein/serine/threonine protein kinase